MRKSLVIFAISLFFLLDNVCALTKAPIDVTTSSMSDLLTAMDNGYLKSETLVKIYLERIDAYDDKFNSINQLNEHALEQAKQLDKERAEGKLRGRLHGIPLLVKCNIDVYGMPTTGGTKSLSDNYPKDNAYAVQKLIDEGAIILGSTNMSELAFSAKTSYSSYGYVKNVFNTDYTAYGSSGGSAVAVGASFAAASLGTDTNSSVRLPAAGAGLVGIRPTMGVIDMSGVIPYDVERDTIGVLSKNVLDNALLFDVITSSNSFELKNTEGSQSLKGVTIGIPTQYLKGRQNETGVTGLTDDDIYKLMEKSINNLESAGANLVYLDNFVKSSNLTIASNTQSGITMCDGFNKYIKGTTGSIRSFEQLAKSSGLVYGLDGYLAGCDGKNQYLDEKNARKDIYRNYVQSYFDDYDLDIIIYPTLKNKVFAYNEGSNVSPGSSLGSVIGFPSITVPAGFIDDFSYGLEFMGTPSGEELLYRIVSSFELVNGNQIVPTKLAPSLYDIPDNVLTLVKLYEETIIYEGIDLSVDSWLDKVLSFFADYNDIEDVEQYSADLIKLYKVGFIKLRISTNFKSFVSALKVIAIFSMLISIFIIYKEIKMCFK